MIGQGLMAGLAADQQRRSHEPRRAAFILDHRIKGPTPADEHGNPIKPGVPVELDETSDVVRKCLASGRLKPFVDVAEPFEGELFAKMNVATTLPGVGYISIGSLVKITPEVAPGFLNFAKSGSIELIHANELAPNAVVVTPLPTVPNFDQVKRHRKEIEDRVLKDLIRERVEAILAVEKRDEESRQAHAFRDTKLELIRHKAARAARLAAEAVEAARLARVAEAKAERANELAGLDVAPLGTPEPPKPDARSPEQIAEARASFQTGLASALDAQRARGDAMPASPTVEVLNADVEAIRRKFEAARGGA